jgi:hypothetical protein
LFTAGSYAKAVAKAIITAGYSARRDPIGHKLAVIRITAGYLKTIGEGPDGELTFCSSVRPVWSRSLYLVCSSLQGADDD